MNPKRKLKIVVGEENAGNDNKLLMKEKMKLLRQIKREKKKSK